MKTRDPMKRKNHQSHAALCWTTFLILSLAPLAVHADTSDPCPANAFTVASITPNGSNGVVSISAAFDGTNYLVGIQGDQTVHYDISAQLVSQAGSPVGSLISVGRTGGAPYVAFDGTNYLMVWPDDARAFNCPGCTGGLGSVYGQFVNPSGALVGSPFLISELPVGPVDESPSGISFDGNNYLVVYGIGTNVSPGTANQLAARFVSPAGVVGSEITLATGDLPDSAVAFNGANYIVTWMQHNGGSSNDVYGVLISNTGTLSAPFRISQNTSPSQNPMNVASDDSNFFVVWPYSTGIINEELDSWELHGRLVAAGGGFGSSEFTVAGVTDQPFFPGIAFDGANYFVSWTDRSNTNDYNIGGQFVTPSGTLLGSALSLVTCPGDQALSPVVYGAGHYLVVWTDGITTNGYRGTAINGLFIPVTPTNSTPTVATPTITPDGGDFADSVKVTLKCATHKAVIYYTTDGREPTSSSPKYKRPITLTNSVTINAVAFAGTNGPSDTATASFTVSTPSITTASELPSGSVSNAYTVAFQATGGTAPYKWSLARGSKLPAGLKLNATTGVLAGKPTKSGTFNFTVKVTDAKKQSDTQSLTLIIGN